MKIKFRGVYTRPIEIEDVENEDRSYVLKLNINDFIGLTADPDFYMTYSEGEFNSIIDIK